MYSVFDCGCIRSHDVSISHLIHAYIDSAMYNELCTIDNSMTEVYRSNDHMHGLKDS